MKAEVKASDYFSQLTPEKCKGQKIVACGSVYMDRREGIEKVQSQLETFRRAKDNGAIVVALFFDVFTRPPKAKNHAKRIHKIVSRIKEWGKNKLSLSKEDITIRIQLLMDAGAERDTYILGNRADKNKPNNDFCVESSMENLGGILEGLSKWNDERLKE